MYLECTWSVRGIFAESVLGRKLIGSIGASTCNRSCDWT